jgi:four helix bundle protein
MCLEVPTESKKEELHSMRNLQQRTKAFAVDVIRFCRTLPKDPESRIIRRQLLRSATSVGANYRAACHAQSRADFIAKLSIVEEEADESQFWLELLGDLNLGEPQRANLQDEAKQIVSIVVASKKTARKRL